MDLLVVCVFAYFLMRHPEVIGEAIAEVAYGLRGEESPAAARRRQRLQDAGIDPASGGAARQFAGNVWRDFWLDQDAARARRRARDNRTAGSTDTGPGRPWWQRMRDAWDTEVDRRQHAWRRRTSPDRQPLGDPADTGEHDWPKGWYDDPEWLADNNRPHPDRPSGDRPGTSSPDSAQPEDREPPDFPGPDQPTDPPDPGPRPDPGPQPRPQPGPGRSSQGTTESPDDREPIRVEATVGDPVPEQNSDPTADPQTVLDQPPLELPAPTANQEGTPTMSSTVATRGIPVTGVQSGAAECASIAALLETAVAEFQSRLDAVAARVHSMGEQTLGNVQFANSSDVVRRMAQAAEATAAARAAAVACGGEVGPLLHQTRREFLLRAN